MNKDVIEMRAMAYAIDMSQEDFARAIGVSKRQYDRYVSKNSEGVPIKVMNSARWIYYENGLEEQSK